MFVSQKKKKIKTKPKSVLCRQTWVTFEACARKMAIGAVGLYGKGKKIRSKMPEVFILFCAAAV